MNLIKLRVASLEDYKKGSLHGLEALNFGTVPKWTTNFFTEKIKLQSHAITSDDNITKMREV